MSIKINLAIQCVAAALCGWSAIRSLEHGETIWVIVLLALFGFNVYGAIQNARKLAN